MKKLRVKYAIVLLPLICLIGLLFFPKPLPLDSVVYIEAYEGWSGAGVVVKSGIILTAGHVVGGATGFNLEYKNGITHSSVNFYKMPNVDLGFIFVDTNDLFPVVFDDKVKLLDDCYLIGNPLGLKWSISKGIISGFGRDCNGFFGEKLMLQADTQSWPGNSGGGAFDKNGKLSGILVGGMWGYDGISFIIPANICRWALEWVEIN